jgi:hypothetical protein
MVSARRPDLKGSELTGSSVFLAFTFHLLLVGADCYGTGSSGYGSVSGFCFTCFALI